MSVIHRLLTKSNEPMSTSETPTTKPDISTRTSSRILVLTIAVSTLLLVIGLAGGWYVHHVINEASAALDSALQAAQATEHLYFLIRDLRLDLNGLAEKGDLTYLAAADKSLQAIEGFVDRTSATATGGPSNERLDLGTLPASAAQFAQQFKQLRGLPRDQLRAAARRRPPI